MRIDFKTQLPEIWLKKAWLSNLLCPLSWLSGALVGLRQVLYKWGVFKSEKVNALVIVVGNAVAGGGGKTPLTMAIVEHLKSAGFQVGVISRGFGRVSRNLREVLAQDSPMDVGDEPFMIRQRCQVPVVVARQRLDAAKALLKNHPETDIVVCDDGLQHYALKRNIEICALDARGIGNGRLLPSGPLREPWPRQVDLLIHTSMRSLADGFSSQRQLSDQAINAKGDVISLQSLKHQPLNAVAAIAQPQAFFDMLKASGLQLAGQYSLPDHDSFEGWTPPNSGLILLCTEKDAGKLWVSCPQAFAVRLLFEPEPAFWMALDKQVHAGLTT
jgi:tetraacyldisaccharide 4'-kinase